MIGPALRAQRGFSLIAAVFLIVVLAALGAFAARIATSQQQTVNLSLLEAQALAAANSGIEYGAYQALKASQCVNATTLAMSGAGLAGFTVKGVCVPGPHVVATSPPPKLSYALDSTATRGIYGQPDFVSRHVARTVTQP